MTDGTTGIGTDGTTGIGTDGPPAGPPPPRTSGREPEAPGAPARSASPADGPLATSATKPPAAGVPDTLRSLRRLLEAAATALRLAERDGDPGARVAHLQTADQRIATVGRLLDGARRELAAGIVREGLPEGACGVQWPACRHCLGVGLAASGGSSWCPCCGRPGGAGAARRPYRCPDPATVTVRDHTGPDRSMCLSHAAGALRRVAHLTVVAATDDELARILHAAATPTRIDRSTSPTAPIVAPGTAPTARQATGREPL